MDSKKWKLLRGLFILLFLNYINKENLIIKIEKCCNFAKKNFFTFGSVMSYISQVTEHTINVWFVRLESYSTINLSNKLHYKHVIY